MGDKGTKATVEPWQEVLYPIYHRALWQFLMDNPDLDKHHWYGWRYIKFIENDCFACEITACICVNCPCVATIRSCPTDNNPLFVQWAFAKTLKERTRIARIIRDSWDINWKP